MVKLTASQKKKLKLHAINQTASHMKKMVKLMKLGDTFDEAHKKASKSKSVKQKQKQKQTQSQKVVINLATPKRRTTKPRANATPNTARVLSQFIQPEQVLPDYRTMINPAPIPMPFMTQARPPAVLNTFAERPPAVREGRILGRDYPLETPIEVTNVLKSIKDVDTLLSGRREPDNTATQGRTLIPEGRWTGSVRSDAGISSLSDTPSGLGRGSSTEATRGLERVAETSEDEDFGGSGMPSPSLMRR